MVLRLGAAWSKLPMGISRWNPRGDASSNYLPRLRGIWDDLRLTAGGSLTTLHSFDGTDGNFMINELVQDTRGNLYAQTLAGGISSCAGDIVGGGCGTIFSLEVGLGPFVETPPTSGKAGGEIRILGNDLTDATSVSFNGTAAAFTVVSSSEIETHIPTGATTGFVTVTTAAMLKSNVKFRVRQ